MTPDHKRIGTTPILSVVSAPIHRDTDDAPIWMGGQVVEIDPRHCTIAKFVARDPELSGIEPIQQLIDSLRSEGQLQPVLCRQIGSAEHPAFEVVMGVRRLLAAQWLRENEIPNFRIRIEVIDMSDRDAFVVMDKENSAHATVSPIERGRSMQRALDKKLFKSQRELAVALKERPATVSTLVRLAGWPAELLAAFNTPFDILMVDAERLGPIVDDETRRGALLVEAERLRQEQVSRKGAGKEPRTRSAVLNALNRSVRPVQVEDSAACTVAKIKKMPDGSSSLVVSIQLPLKSRVKAVSEIREHLRNFHAVEPSREAEDTQVKPTYGLLEYIEAQTRVLEITTS
jgi:ParB/RepB/Spo0J family partition protein